MRNQKFNMERQFLATSILLLLAASAPGVALADTTDCTTISTLPKLITAPGRYCLAAGLSISATTGAAISINASNVVVDCNDNEITYTGASGLSGIRADARADVEVRHCRLVNFGRGIEFTGANRRLWVHDNVVNGATIAGISTTGSDNQVSGNTVTNTTGNNGMVIDVAAGSSALVNENDIRTLNGSGSALNGMRILGGGRAVLFNNIIRDVGVPSTGTSTAIRVDSIATLSPAPTVILNGGLFQGSGTTNYAVRSLLGSAQSVCEHVSLFGYGPAASPNCL